MARVTHSFGDHTMFVIAGVTGHTGSVVANTLLAQKLPVRVIVRDAKMGEAWKAKGAEVAVADLTDAAALTTAFKGASGVYLLIPPNMGATDLVANAQKHITAYKAALTANDVPHVVFLSSIAAHLNKGTGPIISVHTVEQQLSAPKTHFTWLRPGYFMENLLGSLAPMKSDGVLPSFFGVATPVNMVATPDIGAEAAALLRQGKTAPKVVELGSPYSLNDVAAAFGTALSKTIKTAPIPPEVQVATLKSFGLPEVWAAAYAEMNRAVDSGLLKSETAAKPGLISLTAFATSAASAPATAGH